MGRTINVQRNASLRRKRYGRTFKAAAGSRPSGFSKRRVKKRYGYKKPVRQLYKMYRAPATTQAGRHFANSQFHPLTCDPCKIPDGGTVESLAVKSTAGAVISFPTAASDADITIVISNSPQFPILYRTHTGGVATSFYESGSAKAIAEGMSQWRGVCHGWNLRFTGNTTANNGVVRVFRQVTTRLVSVTTSVVGPGESALANKTWATIMDDVDSASFNNKHDSRVFSVAECTEGLAGIGLHTKGQFDYDGSLIPSADTNPNNAHAPNSMVDSQWTYTVIKIEGCVTGAPFFVKAASNIEGIINTNSGSQKALGPLMDAGADRDQQSMDQAKNNQKGDAAEPQGPGGSGNAPMNVEL